MAMSGIVATLTLHAGFLKAAEVGQANAEVEAQYFQVIQPFLENFCSDCHSGEAAEGGVDVSKLSMALGADVDVSPWSKPLAALKNSVMPPPEAAQPTQEERRIVVESIKRLLQNQAEANAGDPGPVVVRRLNNIEYTNTIRALTGVASLEPATEFPAEGAAGEGFMNVGSALSMSPALAAKYYDAAKEVAKHAVFTPTGMRFSAGVSRRDHTDEYIQKIREFYLRYAEEDALGLATSHRAAHKTRAGIIPLERYVAATLREREALLTGKTTIAQVAAANRLNKKYLESLWTKLTADDVEDNVLLADVVWHWKGAKTGDSAAVADRIRAWQKALWKFNPIGRIGQINAPKMWQEPVTPIVEGHELRLALPIEPAEGQDFAVYLSAASPDPSKVEVEWRRPRLVRAGRPDISLRDVGRLNDLYAEHRERLFSEVSQYLSAADEISTSEAVGCDVVAERRAISPIALAAWCDLLGADPGIEPYAGDLIPTRIEMISTFGFVKGWVTSDGASVLANSSDETARTPATYRPKSVVVHPSPTRKVLVVWRSPVTGPVRISASVQDCHPGCGNGVQWSLELRRGKTKHVLWSGMSSGDALESLKSAEELPLRSGDCVTLAIAPRDGDHACDSTEIRLDLESTQRRWSLTEEIVSNILSENPRDDRFGNENVWRFATEAVDDRSLMPIAPESLLARWQLSADAEAKDRLANELEVLLTSDPSLASSEANQQLRAKLRDEEEALLTGVLIRAVPSAAVGASEPPGSQSGDALSFGKGANGESIQLDSLGGSSRESIVIRLPPAVAAGSEFVVEGRLMQSSEDKFAQFRVESSLRTDGRPSPDAPFVTSGASAARQDLEEMCREFRDLFPIALCYLQVVPVDEVITMLLYYREDESMCRLMLEPSEQEELDRLWDELIYVSREPEETLVAFNQLIEYASQLEPSVSKS
jgi:hypothetical protein